MIPASMLLVVVGLILLVAGVLEVGGQPLTLVYASIGACLVAALLLTAGVLRSRSAQRAAEGADGGAGSPSRAADRGDDLPETVPAPAPWATVSEAEEAEAQRLQAMLADVPGLEPHQRAIIAARYRSIPDLQQATRRELVALEGMTEDAAERVLDALA